MVGTTIVTLIAGIIFVSSASGNNVAFAQGIYGATNTPFTFGTIDSVQNGHNGKPSWVLSGGWKTNLINQTQNNPSGAVFNTSFRMIMLNGSADHTHTITNFVLKTKSMPNKTTTIFNGTSTASLREGPVTNVPTSIKVMDNKVLSIWLDPAKVKNHFGNTPIFGIVAETHGGPYGHRMMTMRK